jgi:2-methylcitrate dehydratase PrpD
MDETAELAQFVAETTLDEVPESDRAHGKTAIRDYLGVALFGSGHEVGQQAAAYVSAASDGSDATVLGRGTASGPGAALANGTFGHAIDYDDTFESVVIHPTSPVFPAALAAAEQAGASGSAALTGYLVGTETTYRIGHATYPSHYDHGWHSTGTIGAFGAVAASASVLGMEPETICQGFGIVASGASALKKNFGSMTKPLHAGHAASTGLRATLLAHEGFTADSSILEGDLGYGTVMTPGGEYQPSDITDGLGTEWHVTNIGFKPYPSGVITHAAMDGTRELLEREGLAAADVSSVTVTLDEAASEMLIHEDPTDALQAKFSIEFCVASVLRALNPGIHEFTDEYVQSDELRSEMAKVNREFERSLFGDGFAGYGARVVVQTSDGTRHETEVRHTPGSPSNPVSEDRLWDKFAECAGVTLSKENLESVADAVDNLEEPGSLSRLVESVRGD